MEGHTGGQHKNSIPHAINTVCGSGWGIIKYDALKRMHASERFCCYLQRDTTFVDEKFPS